MYTDHGNPEATKVQYNKIHYLLYSLHTQSRTASSYQLLSTLHIIINYKRNSTWLCM